jgi:hypothetical protein
VPTFVRRLFAVFLLPLAFMAGTSSATDMFFCSMDGPRVNKCCCPETWAEPSETMALHRAPCCTYGSVEVSSHSPAPSSPLAPPLVPLIVIAPLSPFASAPVIEDGRPVGTPELVEAIATGPPLYLKNRSLLC